MNKMFKFLGKWQTVLATLAVAAVVQPGTAVANGMSSKEIDQLVTRTMETFQVPGMAVGILKDGEVIHAKGYGIREVGKNGKVNPKTLFAIASTGKSMTTAALALLVDEGKISWGDKVIDHIPEFRLYDPWVTREFTVKDLLIHNSGLGLGAGDLMMFPSPAFSRQEIISRLRHLKPVSSFRSEYAYDNLLYIVAGEVIASVSGMPYEEFIDERIFMPLNMNHCSANLVDLADHTNIAAPHMVRDGILETTEPDVIVGEQNVFAAAGGIQCSIESILKWHAMHLSKGKFPDGETFLSEVQQTEIMTAQTITPVNGLSRDWFKTSFSAYGLGWALSDVFGAKIEQHSGGLLGMLSINAMVPDQGLGIAIYTNQQAGYARPAILYSILESYLADEKTDWVTKFYEVKQERLTEAAKVVPDLKETTFTPSGSLDRYVGTYRDSWFEDIKITLSEDGLYFASLRSERLKGKMIPFKSDLFIVQWDDRTLDADAYVRFFPILKDCRRELP